MDWEKIRSEYENSSITLKALAEKHDIKLGTLKSRKSREGWSRGSPKKDATKNKKVATPKRKDATKPKEQIEPIVESDELTDKQRLFCIYYVKTFNQTMAAIKAGYSPNSAHVEGSRLLRNAKVADEIRRLKGELQQGVFIDAMDVLNKYIQIAFADITDYATWGRDGTFVRIKPANEIDGTVLSEVSNTENGMKIKLADKMKALEMLSKYFDLLSENDKKRLQEEKLKAETAKAKVEAERLSKENTDDESEEIIVVDAWSDSDE